MAHEEIYRAIVEVNSKSATNELKKMEDELKRMQDTQQRLLASRKKGDAEAGRLLQKDIDNLKSRIGNTKKYIAGLDSTLQDLSQQTYKELQNSVRGLEKLLRSGQYKRHSEQWNEIADKLREAKKEMDAYKVATQEQQSYLGRFFSFLNKNWGAFTQIFGSLTLVNMTVRSAVKDFAAMEEAMANTRKYTGLTDEAIRDLNEDLKRMDTRTSREQLNELAGAAGRLGKTSKKDILEFVEAGNMIQVALGDDLGDGAIDKVGKLAMAFGEDKKIGLRGAMLATGSAINELAQNSSAQAGYLVDFTARVAGFGKQLGLTQAQIMGFGAVMDENMLRDEMAATAFGNMLTKMQTDTAKFAKIAGMDITKFTNLLKTDANAAILALADNLRRADPQIMMKMLDDMGLDGSRAVGVLSTLADKIDDVRARQQLATEAYREGTSVGKEYDTMNNTVEAQLEKTKKAFHEMTVELGGQLLPVMKYTISAGGMFVKLLSTLTTFVLEHKGALLYLASAIAFNTAVYKAHTIQLKLVAAWETIVTAKEKAVAAAVLFTRNVLVGVHAVWALVTKGVQGYIVVMRAAKIATLANPWGALVTVLLSVGTVIYGVIAAINKHNEAVRNNIQETKNLRAIQKTQEEINKQVNESTAEQIVKVDRLTKIIRSNRFSIDERKKAIKTLQSIVPNYHASINREGQLFEQNSNSIKEYINNLTLAAKAEAIYQKKVDVEKKLLDLNSKRETINHSLNSVYAYRDAHPDQMKVTPIYRRVAGSANKQVVGYEESEGLKNSKEQERIHQGRLNYVDKEIKQQEAINKNLDEQLRKNEKLNEEYNKRVTRNDNANYSPVGGGTITEYETTADTKKKTKQQKAAEKAKAKREKEMRERTEAIKAEYKAEIAEEMLAYREGTTTYTDYIEEKHRIAENYYNAMKKLYGEDSTEFKKLLENREKEESEYYQWQLKQDEKAITIEKLQRDRNIRRQFMQQRITDNDAMEEALFQSEMTALKQRQNLYLDGSREWIEIGEQITEKDKERKFQLEQSWLKRLSQYRQEMGKADYDKMLEIELQGVKAFYGALVESGQMTKTEYDAIIEHIKRKYAELKGEQFANQDISAKAAKALETARKNAGAKQYEAGDNATTGLFSISQAVKSQELINEELKRLYGEDYENNREYQEAKRQLDNETMQTIVAGAQAAYSTISSFMSAASSYAQACSDLEVARVTANYDQQIDAAKKAGKDTTKLEKQKEKAIAKAKNDANEKAMAMEYAQAVASTAMAAINAYASASKVAWWLGPIAAGMAVAAGAIQIATIQKQHEAQQASGYYEGGFTGGKNYRREAGVVHEGEFVANHQAVNNPNIAPVLSLIDQAQRNNKVASLRAEDVTNVMGGPAAQVVAPVVNVQTDSSKLDETLSLMGDTVRRLSDQIDEGIETNISIQELEKKRKYYNKLINNA